MTSNPFAFGNPIRDPARFYGRKQEIRQIVSRLLSSAVESTSVVGERRIGKTSLLNYLSNPAVAANLGLTPDRYCLVCIDFQGLTDITPQRFWQRVLGKMARAGCDQELVAWINALRERPKFDLFDLEDLFEGIGERGLHVVLFLDEFEYVTQNPNFGADFFGGLRALAIHQHLALVPATRRELVDLCHSEELKGSPFFNIFANVVLRPLGRQEVDELIEGYVGGTDLAFTPMQKEFVLRLAGRHPCFVQMASHYLAEGKMQGLATDALEAFVTTCFDEQADPHYSYLWAHSSEGEKITLVAILALSRQEPAAKTVPNLENLSHVHRRAALDVAALTKRGLLDQSDGQYMLFSSSFERWVSQEIAAAPGDQESEMNVQEWLKGGGRQNLLELKGVLPRFKKKYWPMVAKLLKDIAREVVCKSTTELVVRMLV